MPKKSLFVAAALAIAIGTASGAQAAEKISIMVGGIEKIIYLPARLAEQLGYYKEAGLDVELLSEPAGVNAEDEMLAGAVQGVVGFYDHTVDLQAKGKFVESVGPVQPRAGRGGTGLGQDGRPDQIAGGFQGQEPGRDRPRLLDQLPDPVPGSQERREAGRVHLRAGGRRQYLHRRNAARTDRRRHDDGANHLAPTAHRRSQDPDRRALVVDSTVRHWAGSIRQPASTCRPIGSSSITTRCKSWRMSMSKRCATSRPTAPKRSQPRCRRITTPATRRCMSTPWRPEADVSPPMG